ncbi:serine hydrolase domain-containing protein [Camelimonas sp. ID_303_24]
MKHCAGFVAAAIVSLVTLHAARADVADVTAGKIQALLPEFEQQVAAGMKAFAAPGVAIAVVHDDRLVYSKGFGVKAFGKPDPVTPDTVFQAGSLTKAFLTVTLAQAVDAGRLGWSDRVVDHTAALQLADPWVTRDFRILDLAAQRSGLTPYVNDGLIPLGFDRQTLFRSMRVVTQTQVFRSDFGYLNIPHMVGGDVVAQVTGAASWQDAVKRTLLDPLGMTSTTATPEAIAQAADHAIGYRPGEPPTPLPFHGALPYAFGPAGAFNSTVRDLAQWLRLQLGRGQIDGKVLVSEDNLAVTWTPRVAVSERVGYALGWVVNATPKGRIIWHNGGTPGFGAHAGFLPDGKTGLVILTNTGSPALADALAQWFYDRVLDNPGVDSIAQGAKAARASQDLQRRQEAAFVAGPLRPGATALAGSYVSPVLGAAIVTVADGKLQMKLEKTDAVAQLVPDASDPNRFQARLTPTAGYAPIVAMAGDVSFTQVQFDRDEAGNITQLRWLNPELPHAFTRRPNE